MRRYEGLVSGFTIKKAWYNYDNGHDYDNIQSILTKVRMSLTAQAINEFRNIDEMNWFEYNDYSVPSYEWWEYPDIVVVLLVTGVAL